MRILSKAMPGVGDEPRLIVVLHLDVRPFALERDQLFSLERRVVRQDEKALPAVVAGELEALFLDERDGARGTLHACEQQFTFPKPVRSLQRAGSLSEDPPISAQPSAKKAKKEEQQVQHIEERSTPRTPVIYEIVRRYGEDEMARPATSLWWSGLAAGLSMSFSLLTQALLLMHLPEAPWQRLLVALGYPVGFVMVVLSRQQLFTENTITVVLPVIAQPSAHNIGRAARMWTIVLAANLAGTLVAALFCTLTPVVTPELREAMLAVSRDAMQFGWVEMIFRGITAGFLMAAMVWLIPASEGAQFYVIFLMSYVIALADAAHIVAGSVEAFLLLANGELGLGALLGGFTLPVLIGNIVGGTVLFALLSYAQVMKEIRG
jgi:formate-nitrite transporter family protein